MVEFNASTPFRHQLETMASTSVLVSVHTSNLANAQFMQPGSAVFELIQRNWFWHGLDRSFQVCVGGRGGGRQGSFLLVQGNRGRGEVKAGCIASFIAAHASQQPPGSCSCLPLLRPVHPPAGPDSNDG